MALDNSTASAPSMDVNRKYSEGTDAALFAFVSAKMERLSAEALRLLKLATRSLNDCSEAYEAEPATFQPLACWPM